MIHLPMILSGAVNRQTIRTINNIKIQGPRTSRDITSINLAKPIILAALAANQHYTSTANNGFPGMNQSTFTGGGSPCINQSAFAGGSSPSMNRHPSRNSTPVMNSAPVMSSTPVMNSTPVMSSTPVMNSTSVVSSANISDNTSIAEKPVPPLIRQVQKGHKVALETRTKLTKIQVKLGWNVTNRNCDVDVSAFLLNNAGKVLGDSWFVFYGQETSPDGSTVFSADYGQDREIISIDFTKLNSKVSKIVFVLTINEALEKNLNFSMLKDAYIRIMDAANTELVSFKMEEYYSNVTSMMIGEIYQHNGIWKFNAIGNGVARDLAGLCELYGVQII